MWHALDGALEEALRDPHLAWSIAFNVIIDSADFPEVRRAAEALVSELGPCDCDRCLGILKAAECGLEE